MRLHDVRVLGKNGLGRPCIQEITADSEPDLDASGLILSPGWADLHAHLRDPGFPEKETLASGSRSAAAGGFTQVVAMANTRPVTDNALLLREMVERSQTLPVRVSFVGAFTLGLEGRELTDAVALKAAGAVALSDDGRHSMDQATLEVGLWRAAAAGLPVLVHAQDESQGNSPSAETDATRGAINALRRTAGAHLHLQHVSTKEAVALIAAAKAEGLRVTAEVTPHHLALSSDEVKRSGALAKVNPPLRSIEDVMAVRQALIDGVIDAIATDHAPHELSAKRDYASAAFGIHGFETALSLVLSLNLPWQVVYRACVDSPRRILGLGLKDEWVLIDPGRDWVVDPSAFRSLGQNTPLKGRRLRGTVAMTVCHGQVVHRSEVPVG
jgi:dihydroorotase